MCSQSLPLFSAAIWAQQGTAHFTLLFMVQVSHHILKEIFPQKTLPLKISSHRSHFSQMCENCRSSGWLYESERKTVSLEHQVAPLRNWSYLREVTHQILGHRLCQLKVWSWRNSSLENAWRSSKMLSLSLTACDLNTFHFLRHCALSASPGWVIIIIFSSQKTEGEMLIFCSQTNSP